MVSQWRSFFGANDETLLNIDIGGGSTELSVMSDGAPDKLFSMKLGAVGLTERFISADPPKTKELKICASKSPPRSTSRFAKSGVETGI